MESPLLEAKLCSASSRRNDMFYPQITSQLFLHEVETCISSFWPLGKLPRLNPSLGERPHRKRFIFRGKADEDVRVSCGVTARSERSGACGDGH